MRRPNNTSKRAKFNTDALSDQNTRNSFVQTLIGKASLNTVEPEDKGVEEIWSSVRKVFYESANEVIPRVRRSKPTWISSTTWAHIEARRLTKIEMFSEADPARKQDLRNAYNERHRVVKKCIKRDKQRRIDGIADRAEIAARKANMRDLYRTASEITQRGRAVNNSTIPKMDTDEKLLVTIEKQMQGHFTYLGSDISPNGGAELDAV